MLGWLAAAAAPLLIHLWSRHRFREAPWAAMQFLLAAMRKNARRIAAATMAALGRADAVDRARGAGRRRALRRTACGRRQQCTGTQGDRRRRLAIHGLSRQWREQFRARQKARRRLVRDSRAGDRFSVILMATPAKVLSATRALMIQPSRHRLSRYPNRTRRPILPATIAVVSKCSMIIRPITSQGSAMTCISLPICNAPRGNSSHSSELTLRH